MAGDNTSKRTGKPIRFGVKVNNNRTEKRSGKSISGRFWRSSFFKGGSRCHRCGGGGIPALIIMLLKLLFTAFLFALTGLADAVRVGIRAVHRHKTWHDFKAGMTKEQREQCDRLKRVWEIQIDQEEKLMDLKEQVVQVCYICHDNNDDKFSALRTKLVQMYPDVFNDNDDRLGIYEKMNKLFWSVRYIEGKLYQELKSAYHHWQDTKEYKFENEIKDPYGRLIYKDGEGVQASYLKTVMGPDSDKKLQEYYLITRCRTRYENFMHILSDYLDDALKTKTPEKPPVPQNQGPKPPTSVVPKPAVPTSAVPTSAVPTSAVPTSAVPTSYFITGKKNVL